MKPMNGTAYGVESSVKTPTIYRAEYLVRIIPGRNGYVVNWPMVRSLLLSPKDRVV